MNSKYVFYSIWVSIIFITLLSCDGKNYIFNENRIIEHGDWLYKNQLTYDFDIRDTSKIYNIYLEINHTPDYTYQNLYLKIHTLFPDGKKLDQQVSFELADKYGQWYGDCNSKSCSLLVDLQKGAYFNSLGKHTISIEQFMRKDPITGVNELAVKIEDTGVGR